MNKRVFFKCILLIFISFCACNPLAKRKTSRIIPMDSVAVMVADCYFLEGEIYMKQKSNNLMEFTKVQYDSLFEKHGVSKDIFVENVNFYFTNEKYAVKMMMKVDEIVEQRVAALRDSLNVHP